MNAKKQIEVAVVEESQETVATPEKNKTCGIIMPIAAMGDYSAGHWSDVKSLLIRACEMAGFNARLVSEAEDARVIQTSIVQNIYDDPIVVCDVSGKNANVMFELGMRLAFNKPVVIVVDSNSGFSFDTSPIEHVIYRRDLRIIETEEFIKNLAKKIEGTYKESLKPEYRSFLSNFSHIQIAKIESTEIKSSEAIERLFEELQGIRSAVRNLMSEKNADDKLKITKDLSEEDNVTMIMNLSIFSDNANKIIEGLKREFSGNRISCRNNAGNLHVTASAKKSELGSLKLKIMNLVESLDDLPY